jgi:O-antigen/teichoic acid export membrane protein
LPRNQEPGVRLPKEHKLYKVLSLNSLSVGVSFILGIFSTKIISLLLGASGMAYMGNFRSFSAMVKSLATLGINNAVVALYVEHKEDKAVITSIYSTLFWLFLVLSALLCGVLFMAAGPISEFLFSTPGFTFPIYALALTLPLIVLNVFWLAVYNALEKFKSIILIQIVSNLVIFLVTVYFIYKGNLVGGLYSIAASEVAMVLVTWLFVSREKEHFNFELQRVISFKYAKVLGSFSSMALLSGVIVPLAAILIRNCISAEVSQSHAGYWDAVQRLSGFYMIFFHTGLSLYYMPKLASITTDSAFAAEVKSYFKSIVVLAAIAIVGVYLLRWQLIGLALTDEFQTIGNYLHWQLAGDLVRIMTLAFGYQIVVKRMMSAYLIVELGYNLVLVGLAFYLIELRGEAGALQAYFIANVLCLLAVLGIFRKVIFSR